MTTLEIVKSKKTAVIVGATGLIGGFCLEQLLQHPAYERVRVLSRRSLGHKHERLEEKIIQFDKLEKYAALFRGHDLFICLGTTRAKAGSKAAFYRVDYTYVYESARLAAEAGANQVLLVSSVGANPDSLFFYSQVKGQVEQAIAQLPLWAVRIFRPSVLLGERTDNRWGEQLAARMGRGIDRLTGGLLSHYRPIEAEYVAAAMINAAQSLDGGVHIYPNEVLLDMAGPSTQLAR